MYNRDNVKELIELLTKNDLTEISVKNGDKEIVIKKEKALLNTSTPVVQSNVSDVEIKTAEPQKKQGRAITSPMVGTFYRASSPTSNPYVEVGDVVSEGQVVCIIEAMKLMNEIESDISGKITEICVQNGENVEFGQTLMYVE